MASDLIKAADDARRLLRGFTALAQVAEALEQVGQLEQRGTEAQARLDALLPQIEVAKTDVLVAKAKAKQLVADALEQAEGHVEAAKQHAADVVFIAKRDADKLAADAEAVVAERRKAAVQAGAERDGALVKRDALLKECDALEARLAKAQASVAKLLG